MWHSDFIRYCLMQDRPINDAAAYGVTILPANTAPGEPYYKVIGVHHLTPAENVGKQNLFADVLDERGFRINGARLEATNINNNVSRMTIDKPDNEPGTNGVIFWPDTFKIRCSDTLPSDTAAGFHTRHPDEGPGNTLGHHSFYVVFQRVIAGGEPEPPQPPPTEPEPPKALKRFTVFRYYTGRGWIPVYTCDEVAIAYDEYVDHLLAAEADGGHVYLMNALD